MTPPHLILFNLFVHLFPYLQGFQCDGGVHPSLNEPYHSLRNCGLLGRDTEAHELFEQTQERRHISVWGMPGVGKSVIVGAIYYKPRTSDNFKKHAWVNVCHSFNPTDFSRSLLLDLHSESTSVEEIYSKTLKTDDHIKVCQLLLHEYKCLIVTDGLRSRKKTGIGSNLT